MPSREVQPAGRMASRWSTAQPLVAAMLTGGLLTLSFPTLGHPAAAWVALVPLLVVLPQVRTVRSAFALGLTVGIGQFGGTLPWLTDVMVEFGGLSRPLGMVLNAVLVAYLALFPALFVVLLVLLYRRFGQVAMLWAAPVWVSTELARLWLFGGFPWELLGYSQTGVLPVSQLASLVGVHGVTALVVFMNSALGLAFVASHSCRVRVLGAAAVLMMAVVTFGSWRLSESRLLVAGTPLQVGLVQGNIPQDEKWDRARRQAILGRYLDLSREAAADGAELIVWPESATPFGFEVHPRGEAVRQLARDTGAHLLFGSTQTQRHPTPQIFNAAFMLRPDGGTAAVYHKMHLVPFGEYVPFKSLLFFAAPIVESLSDFSPGTAARTLPIGPHLTSTAICYEIIYPGLVRRFVRGGSELLTTITNDAWYGRSAAPHQHFQQARMRAIEQGRFLVRAANTGVSGVVDPYGRVLARSALFETVAMTEPVRLLTGLTLYGRIGDVTAYLCLLVTVVGLVVAWRGRVVGVEAPRR